MTKATCNNCKVRQNESLGWWTVTELLRSYSLCPRCYRVRSMQAQREMILERIDAINPKHPDTQVAMGMRLMHSEIREAIRRINFES